MSNHKTSFSLKFLAIASLAVIFSSSVSFVRAQDKVQDKDRDRGQVMLRRIKEDLKKNYYDPKYRGMDLDARLRLRKKRLRRPLPSDRSSASLPRCSSN